jgi:PhnB protein
VPDVEATSPLAPVPEGYHSVTPWIITRDTAALLDFLHRAFGAEELARILDADGRIGHAEARIGDSVVMAFDAPEQWPGTPSFLRLYVADGDAVHARALAAGATSITEMTNLFFGDRVGRVRDPFGNVWWIQTRVEEVALDDMAARASDPAAAVAMQYVQASLGAFTPGATRRV